jgi:hypothetical protein
MATKYTQLPYNRPKGHKIYQHFPFQEHSKFTQNWEKHLATLAAAERNLSVSICLEKNLFHSKLEAAMKKNITAQRNELLHICFLACQGPMLWFRTEVFYFAQCLQLKNPNATK